MRHKTKQALVVDSPPDEDASIDKSYWRNRALAFLARREHSYAELCQKLQKRGLQLAAADDIVAELKADDLQSDARYCEALVRTRAHKGFGPLRVEYELKQQGVALDLIQQHIAAVDWCVVLHSCWHKKFSGIKPQDSRQYLQQKRFLLQRGFSSAQVHAVLR